MATIDFQPETEQTGIDFQPEESVSSVKIRSQPLQPKIHPLGIEPQPGQYEALKRKAAEALNTSALEGTVFTPEGIQKQASKLPEPVQKFLVPQIAIDKTIAGIADWASTPSGMTQLAAAGLPATRIPMAIKFFHDMAKGAGESASAMVDAWNKGDTQGFADALVGTIANVAGAGALGHGMAKTGISKLTPKGVENAQTIRSDTGQLRPVGETVEGSQAISRDDLERGTPRQHQPVEPGTQTVIAPKEELNKPEQPVKTASNEPFDFNVGDNVYVESQYRGPAKVLRTGVSPQGKRYVEVLDEFGRESRQSEHNLQLLSDYYARHPERNQPAQPSAEPVPQQPVTPEGGIKTAQPAPSVTETVTPEPTGIRSKTQVPQKSANIPEEIRNPNPDPKIQRSILLSSIAREQTLINEWRTGPRRDAQIIKKQISESLARIGLYQKAIQEIKPIPTESTGKAAETQVAKEPWQMTLEEYGGPKGGSLKRMAGNVTYRQHNKEWHRKFVEQALSEGKPVPPEVLADYPDLQKQKPTPPTPTAEPTVKQPLEILNLAKQVKVTAPKAATMVRVTDANGKTAVQSLSSVQGQNVFQGAGIKKIEAGIIGADKKFKPVKGDVKVEDKTPLAISVGPGAKTSGEPQYAAIQQLTDSLKANPETGVQNKLNWSDRTSDIWGQGKSIITRTIGKLLSIREPLTDIARGVRSIDDLDRSRARLDWLLQQSSARSKIAGQTIRQQVKSQNVRDAAMIWIDAGGDEVKLRDALSKLPAKTPIRVRKAIATAINLPPEGRELAETLRQFYSARGQDALQSEVMEKLLEDYATHIWRSSDNMPDAMKAAISNGRVSTYFQFARERKIPTFLEGILAGKVPELDAADIIPYYNFQLDKAIASREFIHSAEESITASDGRPMFAPSGTRSTVPKGDTPDALLINPRGKGYVKIKEEPETPEQEKTRIEQTGDYRTIDHPAMRKWKWAAKDEKGNPIFYQADLMIHPEGYERIARMMDRGRLTPTNWGRGALRASTEVKGAKLGLFSLFHPVHVGSHALFHWTNPFKEIRGEPIDWDNPKTQFAVEKGHLKLAPDPSELNVFSEGILQPGLLVQKIPWIGPWSRAQAEWTFGEFIPKLKLATFNNAYARSLWIRNHLGFFKGLSDDQIASRTGDSVNNAFGELNHWFLNKYGRDPRFQRVLRGIFLAPDFGEARLRFAEKTFTRYGHEERLAIATMFLTMYSAARVANYLSTGDPQMDWKRAFSVKIGDHWWSMRSVVSDADRMLADVGKFMYVRLNPLYARTLFDILYGRDPYGRKLTTAQKFVTRPLEQLIPIQFGSLTRDDQKLWESFVGAMGVSAIRDTPTQDVHRLVSQYKEKSTDPKLRADWERSQQQTFGESDYQNLRFALQTENLNAAQKAYQKLLSQGKKPADIIKAMRANRPISGSRSLDSRIYSSLNENDKKIWKAAQEQMKTIESRFHDMLKEFPQGSASNAGYKIGDVIPKNGRNWRVVSFDKSGEPMVVPAP